MGYVTFWIPGLGQWRSLPQQRTRPIFRRGYVRRKPNRRTSLEARPLTKQTDRGQRVYFGTFENAFRLNVFVRTV